MDRRRYLALAVVLVALLAAGCAGSGSDREDGAGGEPRVVATTTQVADLAANVGGDRVRVTSLLKPGIDAHDFEPSPADIETIARADLVVKNGVGLDAWLDDVIERSGYDGPVIDASQGCGCARSAASPTPTSGRIPATPG